MGDTLPRTGKMSYQYDTEIQLTNQTELGNASKNKEDAYTRNTQDKSKNAEHKTTSKQPHKDNSHNKAKTSSLTETRDERPRTRPGHSRTRSDVTANKGARS